MDSGLFLTRLITFYEVLSVQFSMCLCCVMTLGSRYKANVNKSLFNAAASLHFLLSWRPVQKPVCGMSSLSANQLLSWIKGGFVNAAGVIHIIYLFPTY